MASLELIWDHKNTYGLWSWTRGAHKTVRIIRRIKNNVHIAHLGPRGSDPTETVVLKIARGPDEVGQLKREIGFYENDLKHLQGSVVPRCLGDFRGKVDGIDIACLLMEYCAGPPVHDLREFNRQVMLASCRLHQAGIVHGDLLDGRHFVRMGLGIRIVDFSTAVRHSCRNAVPISAQSRSQEVQSSCPELLNMEKTYGLYSDGHASRRAMQRFWIA